jgi:hypothetical protein
MTEALPPASSGPDERQQAILLEITEVARLLDSAFTIPLINKSFGIDPVMGMFWGLGNLASLLHSNSVRNVSNATAWSGLYE